MNRRWPQVATALLVLANLFLVVFAGCRVERARELVVEARCLVEAVIDAEDGDRRVLLRSATGQFLNVPGEVLPAVTRAGDWVAFHLSSEVLPR